MKIRPGIKLLLLLSMIVLVAFSARAQATRTWVSGVGDDANPCSRTAPCKTWAGAISKTAAGGEIDALDPGGFGTVTDLVQERRYATGLDPKVSAAGPGGPPQPVLGPVAPPMADDRPTPQTDRVLKVLSTDANPGEKVTVPVELNVQGSEYATSFSLSFNGAKLLNPVVTLGPGTTDDRVLTTNVKDGELGVLVDSTIPFTTKLVINVTFDVAADAKRGPTKVEFTDDLAHRATSDANGHALDARYEDGVVTISGAASSAFKITGRVLTPEGNGLRNVGVTLAGLNGITRTVMTSSFGYYTFEDIADGATCTITVTSRRYRFASQTVSVDSNLTDVDFVAKE